MPSTPAGAAPASATRTAATTTTTTAASATSRYPPLIVEVLPNWPTHFRELKKLLGHTPNGRPFGKGVRFIPKSEQEFRHIQRYLTQLESAAGISWFCYSLPAERSVKIAICGLPANTEPNQMHAPSPPPQTPPPKQRRTHLARSWLPPTSHSSCRDVNAKESAASALKLAKTHRLKRRRLQSSHLLRRSPLATDRQGHRQCRPLNRPSSPWSLPPRGGRRRSEWRRSRHPSRLAVQEPRDPIPLILRCIMELCNG